MPATAGLSGHYPAVRYYAVLRLLLGHQPSSTAGLPNPGAQQISQGKSLRFRGDPVANTPAAPTGIGHRCHEPAHPANGRLTALHFRSRPPRTYGFFQTRPHGSPPTPNQQRRPAARSIPGRALASSMLGSPCQGPRTGLPPPISTTCLAHSPSAYGLSSATTAHATPPHQARSTKQINRREVEPLQASTAGPLQASAPIWHGSRKSSGTRKLVSDAGPMFWPRSGDLGVAGRRRSDWAEGRSGAGRTAGRPAVAMGASTQWPRLVIGGRNCWARCETRSRVLARAVAVDVCRAADVQPGSARL